MIDKTVFENRVRYANHFCCPNATFYTMRLDSAAFQVVLIYAVRRILPGEEINFNYQWKGTK